MKLTLGLLMQMRNSLNALLLVQNQLTGNQKLSVTTILEKMQEGCEFSSPSPSNRKRTDEKGGHMALVSALFITVATWQPWAWLPL